MELLGIGMDFMAIAITFVLIIGVLLGRRNAMNEYFPILLLLNAITLLADLGTQAFSGDSDSLLLLKFSVAMVGSLTYISISGFNLYIDKILTVRLGKNQMCRVIPFVLSIIMILFWVSSLLHKYAFSVSDSAVFSKGPLFFVYIGLGVGIGVFDFFRVLLNHINENIEDRVAVAIYLCILIPMGGIYLDYRMGCASMFYSSLTVSYLIMFMAIHVHGEQALVEEKMDETIMQTDLLMSQLQPHFMFNSLTNIRYLIRKNPPLAEQAVDKFTKYLRANLSSIESDDLITFGEELEHTKNYIWLEKIRFEDLNVEYSIDVDTFYVPALSLQPIVENAVKHGVTKKLGGGTITIQVREFEEYYKIVVKDDGVGFKMEKAMENEETQTGITDIRRRLYALNKSKLEINSTEGVGTTVTYKIMKGDGVNVRAR